MRLATLVLLAACHASGSPTTPVGNTPEPPAPAPREVAPKPVACQIKPTTANLSATAGAIAGGVCDARTGELLAGVTVVVNSPALQGTQTAITDETGRFAITSLPPGVYVVSFYYADVTEEVSEVTVEVSKQAWVVKSLSQGEPEVIQIGP